MTIRFCPKEVTLIPRGEMGLVWHLSHSLRLMSNTQLMLTVTAGIVLYILIKRYVRRTLLQDAGGSLEDDEADAALSSDESISSDSDAEPDQPEEDRPELPFVQPNQGDDKHMIHRAGAFYSAMAARRSVRSISERPVPRQLIELCIRTAGSSPSGANKQPWQFVVLADAAVKHEVAQVVEAEERLNYERRMSQDWLNDLKPMKTSWRKPYLTRAPYVILVMRQTHGLRPNGSRQTHYYSEMSCCIAVGLLLAAIQEAGLVTVTTTPMNAGPKICRLLNRPANEKLLLLLPVGRADEQATVPDLQRKHLHDVMAWY